jgi:two-component system sensor histidine kinase CreC
LSRRTRIFIGILLVYTAGIAFLLYRVVADIDPR